MTGSEQSYHRRDVMDHLQSLDEVAYVRFASVYRQFTDLNSFIKTIDQLKKS